MYYVRRRKLSRNDTSREHYLVDDMNHTVASLDIGVDDLRHVAAGVSGTLLVDIASPADSTAIFSIGHLGSLCAMEIFSVNLFITHCME